MNSRQAPRPVAVRPMKYKLLFAFLLFCFLNAPAQTTVTQLIHNIWVVDGTGTAAKKAAVRIQGNRIIAVGALKPLPGEVLVDGQGKTLTPGFIDTHSHLQGSLRTQPQAIAALNQGVTTIVSGQDGEGSWIDSLRGKLLSQTIAVNIATYTGQTLLRETVMGEKELHRQATPAEIKKMTALLEKEMQKGSLGLSTGLEYDGAFFSAKEEVVALARMAAKYQGRYTSHIRSEDVHLKEAIEEIIAIGKEARLPVQVSHIKIALKDDWGKAPELLARLEKARKEGIDITADCYPYDFWNSTLKVLFPKTDYTNKESAQFAVDHTFDPNESILFRYAPDPAYKGKTIAAIAALRKETAAETLISLIAAAEVYRKNNPGATGVETIMGKSMVEADVMKLLAWQHTNICSDGSIGGHPRAFGSFTRVLGRYVREKKIMTLEEAVYKMTSLAAQHIGISKRGKIAPGYFADLVLLDPATVQDRSSIQEPAALSEGIEKVWVNGQLVYQQKKSTGVYPGTFISRK